METIGKIILLIIFLSVMGYVIVSIHKTKYPKNTFDENNN